MGQILSMFPSGGKSFPNGTEWTKSNIIDKNVSSVHYNNGLWVAAALGLWYSHDGKTWTQSNKTDARAEYVHYGNGLWLAYIYNEGFYCSNDGKVWQPTEPLATGEYGNGLGDDIITCVDYNNGLWVAGSSTDYGVYYSTDGIMWSRDSSLASGGVGYICHVNGIWFAYASSSSLRYSYDGKTWRNTNLNRLTYGVCYNNDVWIATTYFGVYYSKDGETWVQSNLADDYTGRFVYYSDGICIAGGRENGLYYSTDGVTWTLSNLTDVNAYSVYHSNGIWVATTESGIYCSIDGKTWTPSNITAWANFLYNANGIWVANFRNDGLYYSVTWEPS